MGAPRRLNREHYRCGEHRITLGPLRPVTNGAPCLRHHPGSVARFAGRECPPQFSVTVKAVIL